jgi:hypothetical protein
MHVDAITLRYQNSNARVMGQVTIVDAEGIAVEGANVIVEWTLPSGKVRSMNRLTDANGKANFRQRATQPGTYTLTVTNVEKVAWIYDPAANNETSDWIIVP